MSVKSVANPFAGSTTMSDHASHPSSEPQDPVEEIVPLIPLVLPVMGGVLMFLLAFIAVSMA